MSYVVGEGVSFLNAADAGVQIFLGTACSGFACVLAKVLTAIFFDELSSAELSGDVLHQPSGKHLQTGDQNTFDGGG